MVMNDFDEDYCRCNLEPTNHTHEMLGTTRGAMTRTTDETHSHRLAAVTSAPIMVARNNHVHEVRLRSDTYEGHAHEFRGVTSEAVPVGDRHVHFLKGRTTMNDGHTHEFRLVSLIEDPTGV